MACKRKTERKEPMEVKIDIINCLEGSIVFSFVRDKSNICLQYFIKDFEKLFLVET